MSGNRGCLMYSMLFLIIVSVPLLGHIIVTVMLLEDDHRLSGMLIWLAVIWLMPIPVIIGPLLYLLFGQKRPRGRVMFGQASH